MYCKQCGNETREGAKFCQTCGATTENAPATSVNNSTVQPQDQKEIMSQAIRNHVQSWLAKTSNRVIVTVLASIILIIGIFSTLRTASINVEKYVSVEFSGLNTCGNANAQIDIDQLQFDIYKKLGGKAKSPSEMLTLLFSSNGDKEMQRMDTVYALTKNLHVEISPNENLSNGDKIVARVIVNEDKNLKVKLVGTEKKATVEGLSDAKIITADELFDPANLDIEFVGISPNATVELRNTSRDPFLSTISYTADKMDGLQIGDKINVSASVDEYSAGEQGYIVDDNLRKEFTVDEIDRYITSIDEIDDDTMIKIETQASDMIKGWMAENTYSYEYSGNSYTNETEKAKLFRTLKAGAGEGFSLWGNTQNVFYIAYHVLHTERNYSKTDETTKDLYLFVEFNDLIKRKDGGTDVVITDAKISMFYYDLYEYLYRDNMIAYQGDYSLEEQLTN